LYSAARINQQIQAQKHEIASAATDSFVAAHARHARPPPRPYAHDSAGHDVRLAVP
jgi:hypothetical protein